jgi:hypothetical protein
MSYEKYSKDWNKLTKDEQWYVLLHPWHVDEIKENSRNALKKAQVLFGGGSLHNGAGDAFRHCYWSALLARDLGGDNAQQFTTAHESKPGNPKKEKEMDLYNNGKGIEIGRKNPNASDSELAKMCQNALLKGELKVIKP